MREYHKINSVFKRDERGNFLIGEFSDSEVEYLANNPWTWTEKVDGTNIRVMFQQSGEGYAITQSYGGKTDNAQIPTKLLSWLQDTIRVTQGELREIFRVGDDKFPDVCLYGEGYGAGIQKGGGNYSPTQRFVLFDIKIGNWWLKRADVMDIALKLRLEVVPTIGELYHGTIYDAIEFVKKNPGSEWGDFPLEGVVGTPEIPLFARNGDRIITKIKCRDFKEVK